MKERFLELQDPATKTVTAIGLGRLLNESSLQDIPYFKEFNTEICRSLIASVDYNQTGSLDMNEFMDLWTKARAWKVVFLLHDKDESGSFDDVEFRDALNDLGY